MSPTKFKKSYKKGDTLLVEKPFVFILDKKYSQQRCDYCFHKRELKKCSGCLFVYYCSRNCQKKGWSLHKHECSNVKKFLPDGPPDIVRLLARLIIKLNNGGYEEKSYYTETKFRTFKDLMSHYNAIKKDLRRMKEFIYMHPILCEFLSDVSVPNQTKLLEIYGKLTINSFSIVDHEMQPIGSGLYLGASIIDHCCDPNAMAVFYGTEITIKTLVDMDELDWDKVRISYIEVFDLAKERQKNLKMQYYFDCDCKRCLDTEEINMMTSIFCQNKECKKIIKGGALEKTLKCPHCEETIDDETREEINEVIRISEEKLKQMETTAYIDICRYVLKRQERFFPPINIYRAKILFLAFDACQNLQNWKECLEYGEQVLEVAELSWIGVGDKANLFGRLGKMASLCGQKEKALEYLSVAMSNYLTYYDPGHPYLKIIFNE